MDRRLEENGLTTNAKKRRECVKDVKFYGLILSDKGCSVDPDKVRAVLATSHPETKSDVKSFLGLTNYCSRFIPGYATITEPLRKLTRQDESFHWSEAAEQSFEMLKKSLANARTFKPFDPRPEDLSVIPSRKTFHGGHKPQASHLPL